MTEKTLPILINGSIVTISTNSSGINAEKLKEVPQFDKNNPKLTCMAFEIVGCPECSLLRSCIDSEMPKISGIKLDRSYYSTSLSPDVIMPYDDDTIYPNPHKLIINNGEVSFDCPLLKFDEASLYKLPCRRLNCTFKLEEYPGLID